MMKQMLTIFAVSHLSPYSTIPTIETTAVPRADQTAYAVPTSIFGKAAANPRREAIYIPIATVSFLPSPASLADFVKVVAFISRSMETKRTPQHRSVEAATQAARLERAGKSDGAADFTVSSDSGADAPPGLTSNTARSGRMSFDS
uniref:Uncharacterized protein n=1 Tax=Trieres chinensis TaxID=1514140 RepID=A0A7S1Z711_TRICV|mmetsp:Transcript_19130/g.38811  ORF Transcript_19130/g.38811 Transcript_19130/m.38811 type:complete len:146 (+) Transcript_19130:196-633(+)